MPECLLIRAAENDLVSADVFTSNDIPTSDSPTMGESSTPYPVQADITETAGDGQCCGAIGRNAELVLQGVFLHKPAHQDHTIGFVNGENVIAQSNILMCLFLESLISPSAFEIGCEQIP